MDENMKIELNPQFDFESECEKVELEIINPANELDARLDEIDGKISDLDISIDKLTNDADKLDYIVAVASGIIAGLIDSFFVGETEIDKDKIQELLESKYHTANDDEYRHKDENGNWISSAMYHRLDDLAHHPTFLGLVASILVRYFRLVVFIDGSDGKPHVFFAGKPQNKAFQQLEVEQLRNAWMGVIISGLFMWLATLAESKCIEENNGDLPKPLKNIIIALKSTPVVIEILKAADTWIGHMMSDVSTSQGIPGIFLSLLKEISVLPVIRNTNFRVAVDGLYNKGEHNLSEWGGVAFVATKKQAIPVLANEILVRGFYFVRRLIAGYQYHKNFKEIDWESVIPFGNRTIERMITISSGTFTAVDTLDAVIRGAISGAKAGPGFWAEFGRQVVLRLNFVGIGRFTIALGTDTFMGLRKGKKSRERMLLKAESLYLLEAKMYYGDQLMWTAVKDAGQSVDCLFEAMQKLTAQITEDMKAAQGSIREIENVDVSAIDANNKGLTTEILDIL